MPRATRGTGTFVRIPLADGSFAYGRILDVPYTAFYDYRTIEPSTDLALIATKRVLFSLVVRGRSRTPWDPIGWLPLSDEVARPVVHFMQDLADYRKCTIFDSAGLEKAATPEECVGLECAAVYEVHHVTERLLDELMGRTNPMALRMGVRLTGAADLTAVKRS